MDSQKFKFRAYFLGQLTDNESVAVELDIISEATLEDKLHLAESELIEDYLDEMLAPGEKDLFNRNFLQTPERQKRLDFLRLLKNHAKEVSQTKEADSLETEKKLSLVDALKNIFSVRQSPAPALIALLVLVLAIGFSWIFFFYNAGQSEFSSVEKGVQELNQKDFSNLSEYENLSNLRLISGNLRSSGNKNNLAENNLTSDVLLRLLLPIEVNSDKFYTAKIIKDGKSALTLNQIYNYQNNSGREIRLLLPASILKKGEYQIELREENSAVENGKIIYTFAIQ